MFTQKKNYYFDYVGGFYYSGIGVTSKQNRVDTVKSGIKLMEEYLNNLPNLSRKDILYLNYSKSANEFKLNPSFGKFFHTIKLYIQSIELKFGVINKSEIKSFSKMMVHLFTTNY